MLAQYKKKKEKETHKALLVLCKQAVKLQKCGVEQRALVTVQ